MKKVVFFVITILMGLMLLTVTYQGFYMDNVQGMIQTALDEKNYDNLAKSFIPFFNKEEINHPDITGKCDVITYEGLVGEQVKVTFDDKETTTNRYQEALVFFIDDIEFTVEGVEENGKFYNYTSLNLYNEEDKDNVKELVYSFNDPITAKDPNAEDVIRYYTDAAKQLKFVMLSISKKLIDEKLGGKVTKITVVDGHKEEVGSIDLSEKPLTFDSQFFNDASQIVVEYDKYLKDPNDKNLAQAYNDFYKTWYENYTKNENYGLAYLKGEISMTSTYLKTGGVMAVYVAICCLLGFYILRKKPTLIQQVRNNKPTTYRTTNKVTNKVTEETGSVSSVKNEEKEVSSEEKVETVVSENVSVNDETNASVIDEVKDSDSESTKVE